MGRLSLATASISQLNGQLEHSQYIANNTGQAMKGCNVVLCIPANTESPASFSDLLKYQDVIWMTEICYICIKLYKHIEKSNILCFHMMSFIYVSLRRKHASICMNMLFMNIRGVWVAEKDL